MTGATHVDGTDLGCLLSEQHADMYWILHARHLVFLPASAESHCKTFRSKQTLLTILIRTPSVKLVLIVCLQATAELVYGTVQAVIFSCVLYFAAGFARDAGKFFWFLLFCW